MQENFRQFLDRLRQTGELVDLHQPVDIRHIATLVDQARTALFFHNVVGYDIPVVSGIIRSRERATMALGCEGYGEIEEKLKAAIDKPIPPRHVRTSPTREVTYVGDDVDLYKLPIPMSSIYDGGPMITAGVVIARDPELGVNSGVYRFIVKEKSLTGIDIVADMGHFAGRRGPHVPGRDRRVDRRLELFLDLAVALAAERHGRAFPRADDPRHHGDVVSDHVVEEQRGAGLVHQRRDMADIHGLMQIDELAGLAQTVEELTKIFLHRRELRGRRVVGPNG